MAIRLVSTKRNSKRIQITFQVIGDVGEAVDCEGVSFGEAAVSLPPTATVQDVADAVKVKAQDIYAEGYAAWELHNQLAPLLKE